MHNVIERVLLSETDIDNICESLGKKITLDYQNKPLLLVGLLKGCNPFLSDLAKRINLPLEIHYMKVSSYSGTKSSGNINIDLDLNLDITNKDILIVEDIVDTGYTLTKVLELLNMRNPNSIEIVTLLDKPEGRIVPLEPKYIGASIPKEFVIGYGLDFDELYRNLPYVGILKKEMYMK